MFHGIRFPPRCEKGEDPLIKSPLSVWARAVSDGRELSESRPNEMGFQPSVHLCGMHCSIPARQIGTVQCVYLHNYGIDFWKNSRLFG